MFLDSLKIKGIKTTNVPIMDAKTILIPVLKIKCEITKAATAKAIPTP